MISIELVVAVAQNGVIGAGGKMPWHIPDDLKHFKKITTGHPILMGRKTWESLPRKPLPNRKNIVMTSQSLNVPPEVICVATIEEAIAAASEGEGGSEGGEKLMVIGGGKIYKLFEPYASCIHLTEINADIEGDTYFHITNSDAWQETSRETHPLMEPNSHHSHPYAFTTLVRIK